MEYIDTVKDYLSRCQNNLNIIQNNKGYGVTQLLSNFISCLIFIKENRVIDENSLSDNGLECDLIYNSYNINFKQNTKEFIRHLRNACCHYGITIEPKDNEIYKVKFIDNDSRNGYKCKFEMTITQIEKVYKYLLGLI